jgi:hypothetical protein
LVFILKLVLHFFLLPETEETVNYDKKIYKNFLTLDYYIYKNDSLVKNTSVWSSASSHHSFTKKGEEYIKEPGICDECRSKLFYYPKEIHAQSFKAHLQKIFSNKPYIFLISICILLLLVILFNDKIKAR